MRRHINTESDIEVTSEAEELQKTFALLLPIRRQRLSRSERIQRQEERALHEAGEKTEEAHGLLKESQQQYREVRDGFDGKHTGQQLKQEKLMQGLEEERAAGEHVVGQQRQLVECQNAQQQQQHRVSEAQQDTRARQRDLEKLEFLMSETKELS